MRTMTLMLGAALLLSSALPSEAAPPDQAAIRAQVGTVEVLLPELIGLTDR